MLSTFQKEYENETGTALLDVISAVM